MMQRSIPTTSFGYIYFESTRSPLSTLLCEYFVIYLKGLTTGDLRVTMCNNKCAELFGVNEHGVRGEDCRKIFPQELDIFVREVLGKDELTREVTINDVEVKARGVTVEKGEHKAITLLLDWE